MPIDTDFLVVGSGIGGLWTALRVARHGSVILVTKKEEKESNTNYAQGGIAGVMDPVEDSPELHIADTLAAGAGLCDPHTVEILVREGPARIRELIEFGANFTKDPESNVEDHLSLGREGGHSRRRIVRAADLTGREIERALLAAVREERIRVLENHLALELVMHVGECRGVHVLDRQTRQIETFLAKATILASGGAGQIYPHTTNPPIATGDGVAMAYRAGARISDMEFIQFHPTSLCHPAANSFLISEAVRGEGGILRLKDGSTFMKKYHELGDLAPRDVVARAIQAETLARNEECAYLDVTHLDPEEVKRHFPTIYERCLHYKIDITKQWIPVVPAAHYSCGGVQTDDQAKSSIPRLYAVGEVACTGVHGANRLASNSLLEAVVFAERAAHDAEGWDNPTPIDVPPLEFGNEVPDTEYTEALTYRLRSTMWREVGIVRSNASLQRAEEELTSLCCQAEAMYRKTRPYGALIELRNMATVALLVVRCALMRKESRGLHYTTDYPDLDPTGPHHSILDRVSSPLPDCASVKAGTLS